MQSLKDEFTQRIADTERKAQLACKERDIAKKVTLLLGFESVPSISHKIILLHRKIFYLISEVNSKLEIICGCNWSFYSVLQEIKGLREELSTRLNSSDTMELIRDKEEQIRGLLEEGKTCFF